MQNTFTQIGLGTSTLASLGKSLSFKNAKKLFDVAIDYNIRTIDTADTYGSGDAERLIGKITKGKRKDLFIISKVGYPYLDVPRYLSPINQFGKKLLQGVGIKKNFTKKYIINNIEKSLKRLNTDYLDTYLLHDLEYSDISKYKEEFMDAFYMIKKKGLSRYVGISSNNIDLLEYSFEKNNLDVFQTKMIFNKKSTTFNDLKKKGYQVIVNSIVKQSLEKKLKISKILEKFDIKKDYQQAVLIAYYTYKHKLDCVLVGTQNINHLMLIGGVYEKYEKNFYELFSYMDEFFL